MLKYHKTDCIIKYKYVCLSILLYFYCCVYMPLVFPSLRVTLREGNPCLSTSEFPQRLTNTGSVLNIETNTGVAKYLRVCLTVKNTNLV
jgi:hypothetical protein